MPSCGVGLSFVRRCEVGCDSRALQHHGNGIVRRAFRTGMAPYANALFALAQPEPPGLGLHGFAGGIQQLNPQRHIPRDAQVEGAVLLYLRCPLHLSAPLSVACVQADGCDGSLSNVIS